MRGTAKRSRMTSLQASRTLVKSPPELWAELSELGSLARHLGEFGEIRITKVDPESRVEWEADRASGTVRLEPSGWGTRVVLTVDTPEPAEVEARSRRLRPVDARAGARAGASRSPNRSRAGARARARCAAPEPEPVKRGWFARLFRRRTPAPAPAAALPGAVRRRSGARTRARAGAEPEPQPDPQDSAFGTIEWETPTEPPLEEPEPEPLAPDEAHAVLTSVLDTLGAAHHRPFSRS